jgi:hypothetical protein
MNKTLISLLAIGTLLGAGTALAASGTLGGSQDMATDIDGHVDYSGVLSAVDDTKGQLDGVVQGATDVAAAADAQANAQTQHTVSVSKSATVDAKQGILDSIGGNLESFAGWIQGLYVKPTIDAKPAMDMTASGALADQVAKHDGKLDAYYGNDLASTARVDYNIPPPPTPDTGFLHQLKLAFEGALHFE